METPKTYTKIFPYRNLSHLQYCSRREDYWCRYLNTYYPVGLNLHLNPRRFPMLVPRELTSIKETTRYDSYENYVTFEGKFELAREMQTLNEKSKKTITDWVKSKSRKEQLNALN